MRWLQHSHLITDEVVYSAAINALLAAKRLPEACSIACLGATQANWVSICTAALDAMQLSIARTACQHEGNVGTLALVRRLHQAAKGGASHQELQAMRLAFEVQGCAGT